MEELRAKRLERERQEAVRKEIQDKVRVQLAQKVADILKKNPWWIYNNYCCWRKKCLLMKVNNPELQKFLDPDGNGNVYRCLDKNHYQPFHICGKVKWDGWTKNRQYTLPNDRDVYRCPVTLSGTDNKLVCAMTGHLLEDHTLPDFGPLHLQDLSHCSRPLTTKKERRAQRRVQPYLKSPKGSEQLCSDDTCDLIKQPDDLTLYTLIMRGEVQLMGKHLAFLEEWLSEDQVALFTKVFIRIMQQKVKTGSTLFRKSGEYQIWNCVYECVSGQEIQSTYRLYTNLARNLKVILTAVAPDRFNTYKL